MGPHVCTECREDVDEDAQRCPHCGYDAGATYRKRGGRAKKLGAILCLTIIGIPLGVLLILAGVWRTRKGNNATVGTPA